MLKLQSVTWYLIYWRINKESTNLFLSVTNSRSVHVYHTSIYILFYWTDTLFQLCNLSEADLKQRTVEELDIAYDEIQEKHYKEAEVGKSRHLMNTL